MSDRKPRLFADWRFAISLAFLLMVGYLVLTGVSAIRQDAEKGRQIEALIASGRQADAEARRERDHLLTAQHRLLVRIDAYDARQRALLAYLRKHGVEIPTRFVQAPSFVKSPAGGGRRSSGSSPQAAPAQGGGSQGTPAPSSVGSTGPGKSDGHANPHAGSKRPSKAQGKSRGRK